MQRRNLYELACDSRSFTGAVGSGGTGNGHVYQAFNNFQSKDGGTPLERMRGLRGTQKPTTILSDPLALPNQFALQSGQDSVIPELPATRRPGSRLLKTWTSTQRTARGPSPNFETDDQMMERIALAHQEEEYVAFLHRDRVADGHRYGEVRTAHQPLSFQTKFGDLDMMVAVPVDLWTSSCNFRSSSRRCRKA